MGFAVYRISQDGSEECLPSHAVFQGKKIQKGQTTEQFPIQKFYWKDVYARLIAEKTGKNTFRYKIVPLGGTPGKLKPLSSLPHIISNEVQISPQLSTDVAAYFNRGLISTQRVSRAFDGNPAKGKLLDKVADPKDPLRASLSGDMVEALTGFIDRAKKSGTIYAALYELSDEELIQKLEGLGKRLYIVLSNADSTDAPTANGKSARERLQASGANKWDRIMPQGHIGHNKYCVYVDKNDKPQAVLLGSTNWTPTGLCTQTNNTMVIKDAGLAKRYIEYWNHLKADTEQANGDSKKLQATDLRTWDATGKTLKGKSLSADGISSLQSWFSPNTPKQRSSNTKNEKIPPDMQAVIQCIKNAKHAILFLAFYPGTPSIVNWTADALKKNKGLFVRGCMTNKNAAGEFYYELKGKTPPKTPKGEKAPPIPEDPRVIAADTFDTKHIPAGWQKEILSAGFAIIHDKIMVIDPFSDNCTVITGSHNLGDRASYNNDENLVIVQGNKKLAMAYATHVLDVYDHFSWRYNVKSAEAKGSYDGYLASTPDEWLNRYYDTKGNIKNAQLNFWMQAAGE